MAVIYGLLGLLALVAILLCVPVYGDIRWDGTLHVRVRYLCLGRTVCPRPEKAPAAETEKPSVWHKAETHLRDRGLSDTLHDWSEQLRALTGAARRVLRAITVDRLRVEITVAGEDAADTALLYGRLCAVLYTAVGLLASLMRVRSPHVVVTPLFDRTQPLCQAETGEARLRVVPWRLVGAAVAFLWAQIGRQTKSSSPASVGEINRKDV